MNELPPEVLGQRWVHVQEEDTDDEMVFRPADQPLPPARGGRERFEFKPDGTFLERAPGPTDAPEERSGSWKLEEGKLLLESDDAPEGLRVLEISAAEPDRLVVKK